MSLLSALIAYFLTTFLSIGIPVLTLFILRKKGKKVNWFHFLLGMIVFIAVFAIFFIILKFHLNISDGISDYFNTAAYRVVIISLVTVIITVLLWVSATVLYIKRQNYQKCISFFAGFGCSGSVWIGIYSFAMLLVLLIKKITSSFVGFDDTVKAFVFSDEVYVSVFTPVFGHVSYAVALLAFLICEILLGLSLCRIGKRNLPFWTSFCAFLGFNICITFLVNSIIFSKMFLWKHYYVAILSIAVSFFCFVLAWATGHFVKKTKNESYEKQFD